MVSRGFAQLYIQCTQYVSEYGHKESASSDFNNITVEFSADIP